MRDLRVPILTVAMHLTLMSPIFGHAQVICNFNEQTRSIRMTQHKQIFFDLGKHKSPNALLMLYFLIDPKSRQFNVQAFVDGLKEIEMEVVKDHSKRIDRARELIENPQLMWIAVESVTTDSESNVDEMGFTPQQRFEALKQSLQSAGISSSDIERMLSLLEGPTLYIWRNSPELQRRVALRPVEDATAYRTSTRMSSTLDKQIEELSGLVPRTLSQDQFNTILKEFNAATAEYKPVSESEVQKLTSSTADPSTAQKISDLLGAANRFYENNETRENAVAKALTELNGNGIVQFGGAHNGIIQRLKDRCSGEITR
jgi:hypothetical protein